VTLSEKVSFDQSGIDGAIEQFSEAGIDVDTLGLDLQDEGAKSFLRSWAELMDVIATKGAELSQVK
jgi:transaldolase